MPKTVSFSEIDAMKAVDVALEKLDDEARRRVMNWAASKFSLASFAGGLTTSGAPASEQAGIIPKDIKGFLAKKKPDNFYERVACLAYYLEKVEEMTELKTNDITKANSDARTGKMSNPALFVKHSVHTYGYLTSLGHGKFGVSSRGEALVDALPDREKVAAALEEHPFKRGRKGRRRKKKKTAAAKK